MNYASFGQIFDKNQNFNRFQSYDPKINPYNVENIDVSFLHDVHRNRQNHSSHEVLNDANNILFRKRESNANVNNNNNNNLPDV